MQCKPEIKGEKLSGQVKTKSSALAGCLLKKKRKNWVLLESVITGITRLGRHHIGEGQLIKTESSPNSETCPILHAL